MDKERLYNLAYHSYKNGQYTRALTLFQALTQSFPLYRQFWVGLASSAQMEKKYETALTGWSMSALMDEDDSSPHFHAAECLLSLGQIQEAKKALQLAKEGAAPSLLCKIEVMESRWAV